jgi:ribosome-associated toxin RatA of RatAB toxin-antitoxin module
MFANSSNAPLTAGGRQRVHRLLAFAALAIVLARPAAADIAADPSISVHEEKGVYRVAATFGVPQSPALAVAVLTDYEQIPRFMPDVRTSTIIGRAADHVVVEQEAIARLMMFSKRIHLVLEVREQPGRIQFRDRCGKSFTKYEGSWTIAEKDGQTAIRYELNAQPSFDVPEWLLKRLLKRDATQMIQRLQAEIASRAK